MRPEAQPFLARLPALASGQRLEYRAELRRAGRLIDVAPADGTWMTMTAEAASPAASIRDRRPRPTRPGARASAYELELLGALTVRLRPEVLGHTPEGYRINFFVVQGEIRGPRLQRHGTARRRRLDDRPSGRRRRRSTSESRTRCTTVALVLEQSGGVIYVGPEGYETS